MSQCATCVRLRSPFSAENTAGLDGPFCAAYPHGIPDRVFANGVDHRHPEGSEARGADAQPILWESNGRPFPEWAFLPQYLGEQPKH
jgi:hypothetical protein